MTDKSNFKLLDKAFQVANNSFIKDIQELKEDIDIHIAIINKIPKETLLEDPCFNSINNGLIPLQANFKNIEAQLESSKKLLSEFNDYVIKTESNPDFVANKIAYKKAIHEATDLRDKFQLRMQSRLSRIYQILDTYRANDDFMSLVKSLKTDKKGKKKLPFYQNILSRFNNFWPEYDKFMRLTELRDTLISYVRSEDHFGLETVNINYNNFIQENFPDYVNIKETLLPEITKEFQAQSKEYNDLQNECNKLKEKTQKLFEKYFKEYMFSCSPSFKACRELNAELETMLRQQLNLIKRKQDLIDDPIFCKIFSASSNIVLPDDTLDVLVMYLNNSGITKATLFSTLYPEYNSLFSTRITVHSNNLHSARAPIYIKI